MKQSSEDSIIDFHIFTIEEQQFCDIIPTVWSDKREEREVEIASVTEELRDFIIKNAEILPFALKKINELSNQSPYYNMNAHFKDFGFWLLEQESLQWVINDNLLSFVVMKKKPLSRFFGDEEMFDLQRLIRFMDKGDFTTEINSTVRKLKLHLVEVDDLDNLEDSDGEWEEDEITYDPLEKEKQSLNLLVMRSVSFKKLQKMLADLYRMGNQKITNVNQLLLMFPDYLKIQVSLMKKVFNSKKINDEVLNIMAIQAAAGIECQLVIHEMVERYILGGGEQDKIINGFVGLPMKMKKLASLFKILSQHPAQLISNPQIIHYLIHTQKGNEAQSDQIWQRQQLMQAIILFAVIQCKCTIHQILGVESQSTPGGRVSIIKRYSGEPVDIDEFCTNEQSTQNHQQLEDLSPSKSLHNMHIETEDFKQRNHFLGNQEEDEGPQSFFPNTNTKNVKLTNLEFNWEENCQSIIKDFFPKLAHKLNKCFKSVRNMHHSIPYDLRRAIFLFSQFTLGYIDDSYDYSQIKILLSQSMQSFIRKAIHRPWSIKLEDLQRINGFLSKEIVHIAIIIANAKMFAQILMSFSAFR